jgi:hypothetical protein
MGPDGGRAFYFDPAPFAAAEKVFVQLEKEQIKDAFNIWRDSPPALFVAFDRFERDAQEFGHFPLRALEHGPDSDKSALGHFI